eukprot:Nk52_evm6s367 gene=Nk52_evmTU6s367
MGASTHGSSSPQHVLRRYYNSHHCNTYTYTKSHSCLLLLLLLLLLPCHSDSSPFVFFNNIKGIDNSQIGLSVHRGADSGKDSEGGLLTSSSNDPKDFEDPLIPDIFAQPHVSSRYDEMVASYRTQNQNLKFRSVFFFGDDLLDIGNYPEARTALPEQDAGESGKWAAFYSQISQVRPKTLMYLFRESLAVPVTNPIHTEAAPTIFFTDEGMRKMISRAMPSHREQLACIPNSLLSLSLAGDKWKYRPIGLPDYLMQEMRTKRLNLTNIKNAYAASSMYSSNAKDGEGAEEDCPRENGLVAMSYAFTYAMTMTTECSSYRYGALSSRRCSWEDVFKTDLEKYTHYFTNHVRTIGDEEMFRVPSLMKQLSFFASDYRVGYIDVNEDSLIYVWVGFAELRYILENFAEGTMTWRHCLTNEIIPLAKRIVEQIKRGLLDVKNMPTDPASIPGRYRPPILQVYLLEMFDLSLTPRFSGSPVKTAVSYMIVAFNLALRREVFLYNLDTWRVGKQITLVPSYNWFNTMAYDMPNVFWYRDSFGNFMPCASTIRGTGAKVGSVGMAFPENESWGKGINCQGFLFWDNWHPTTYAIQYISIKLGDYTRKSMINTQNIVKLWFLWLQEKFQSAVSFIPAMLRQDLYTTFQYYFGTPTRAPMTNQEEHQEHINEQTRTRPI